MSEKSKSEKSNHQKYGEVDVLLVYPIWVVMGKRGTLQRMLPPMGILSLASYLESHGHKVQVIDMHAEEMTPTVFRRQVRQLRPRHIGITVLSAHVMPAHFIAQICKEEVHDCQVYVGGVHAEAYPEQMLSNPDIDAVGRGDGEEILLELVQGKCFKSILGLSYRDFKFKHKICHNPLRPISRDLDQYPLPAYHLINFNRYFPPMASYKNLPAMNILLTRGCPGKCNFCNSANTVLRSRSAASIVELIKNLRKNYGIRQIYFYDDTFTANPGLVREFCHLMIEEKIDVKWICYVRGDMFREPVAALMARAGCHQVLMGVESGSASLMAALGKPIDKEQYKRAVEMAHRFGIEVRGSFIIGHPEETRKTLQETLDFAIEMKIDFFQLSIMTPYPGTLLFKQLKENGLLLHEDFSRYGQNEIVFQLKSLSSEEIYQFEKYSMIKFYFRPSIIKTQILRFSQWNHVKDIFKAFIIIILGKVSFFKKRDKELEQWLHPHIEWIYGEEFSKKVSYRLTNQVRQDPSTFQEATT